MAACPRCGYRVESEKYCSNCGEKLGGEHSATPGETYLGGFFGLAKRRGLAYFVDYGLFVTDRRVIILNKNVFPPHGLPGVSQMRDQIELTVNATPARLDELKKEAEFSQDDIVKIHLSRPALFRKGALTVSTKSGETSKLTLMDDSDGIQNFGIAKDLLQKFAPERLEVEESGS